MISYSSNNSRIAFSASIEAPPNATIVKSASSTGLKFIVGNNSSDLNNSYPGNISDEIFLLYRTLFSTTKVGFQLI